MKKLDYEVREFCYKEKLTNDELSKLIDRMNKQGFEFEGFIQERLVYSFVKFCRK